MWQAETASLSALTNTSGTSDTSGFDKKISHPAWDICSFLFFIQQKQFSTAETPRSYFENSVTITNQLVPFQLSQSWMWQVTSAALRLSSGAPPTRTDTDLN